MKAKTQEGDQHTTFNQIVGGSGGRNNGQMTKSSVTDQDLEDEAINKIGETVMNKFKGHLDCYTSCEDNHTFEMFVKSTIKESARDEMDQNPFHG